MHEARASQSCSKRTGSEERSGGGAWKKGEGEKEREGKEEEEEEKEGGRGEGSSRVPAASFILSLL